VWKLKGLAPTLQELSQFGFGTPSGTGHVASDARLSGTEHVPSDARLWHEMDGGGSLLILDSENAFNSIDRAKIIRALERFGPGLLPFFDLLYI
jgi:hypothetical protein